MNAKQIAQIRQIYRDRKCAYCGWMFSAVNWWCGNAEIIKLRGTRLPGICHCPGWKPDKSYIAKRIRE